VLAYELVSGAGDQHNNLFTIEGDKLYLKDNHGLSGITTFTVRVRSTDSYGNSVESVFTVEKVEYNQVNINIPNTFSPNGDGINDTWVPSELRFYNDVVVEVFDRSGVPLYKTRNPELGWDGRANGGRVLEGPFFYIIHINDLNITKKGVLINVK
jgi:gliding motility-associated-like protein